MEKKVRSELFCNFCLKANREVSRMIGGAGVYICGSCVKVCAKILLRSGFRRRPDFAGWDSYTDSQLLASLAPSEQTLQAVRRDLQVKVEILRKRGTSWEAIGNALGTSRQAAWERFSQR
jgi:epoxyqueuosine reductase QueG